MVSRLSEIATEVPWRGAIIRADFGRHDAANGTPLPLVATRRDIHAPLMAIRRHRRDARDRQRRASLRTAERPLPRVGDRMGTVRRLQARHLRTDRRLLP